MQARDLKGSFPSGLVVNIQCGVLRFNTMNWTLQDYKMKTVIEGAEKKA